MSFLLSLCSSKKPKKSKKSKKKRKNLISGKQDQQSNNANKRKTKPDTHDTKNPSPKITEKPKSPNKEEKTPSEKKFPITTPSAQPDKKLSPLIILPKESETLEKPKPSPKSALEILKKIFTYLAQNTIYCDKENKKMQTTGDDTNLTTYHAFMGAQLLFLFKNRSNIRLIYDLFDTIKNSCQYHLQNKYPDLQLHEETMQKFKNLFNHNLVIEKKIQKKLVTKNIKKNINILLNLIGKNSKEKNKIKNYLTNVFDVYNMEVFTMHSKKYLTQKQKIPNNLLGLTVEILQHIHNKFDFIAVINKSNQKTMIKIANRDKNSFKKILGIVILRRLATTNSQNNKTKINEYMQKPLEFIQREIKHKLNAVEIKLTDKLIKLISNICNRYNKLWNKDKQKLTEKLDPTKNYFFATFACYTDDYHFKLWLEKIHEFSSTGLYKPTVEKFIRFQNEQQEAKKQSVITSNNNLSTHSTQSLTVKTLTNKPLAYQLAFLCCKFIICGTRSRDIFANFNENNKKQYQILRLKLAKTILVKLQEQNFYKNIKTKEDFIKELPALIQQVNTLQIKIAESLTGKVTHYINSRIINIQRNNPNLPIQPLTKDDLRKVFSNLLDLVKQQQGNTEKALRSAKIFNKRIKKLANTCGIQYCKNVVRLKM